MSNCRGTEFAPQSPGKSWFIMLRLYCRPKSQAGNESNWVPTSADGKFEVLFRLYGPQKPLFDKTWSCRTSRSRTENQTAY
jgi:hypothetical protein